MAGPATYVAMLRGINVGGNKRIKMADLREMVTAAGGCDVSTYIQSGNVLLRSSTKAPALRDAIEAQITAATGFDVSVIIRTLAEMRAVVKNNPWAADDIEGTRLVVMFFQHDPPAAAYAGIDPAAFTPERLVLRGRDLYLHLPDGQARSKLVEAIGKQKVDVPTTARNWKSVTTLLELAEATAALPT